MSNPAAAMSQHLDALMMPLRYVDKLRAKSDIMNLLAQSRSLAPKVAQHVHNNGQTETLLSLTGTIPIWFQTVQYNIPVTIWVPEQYPHRPPFPYVTPTRDMCIKDRHKHVDLHGLVYLPYLNQWSAQSTLAELVIIMSSVFSEEPPVFRKPLDQQPPQYQPPPATQPLAHQPHPPHSQPPQPQPQPPPQLQPRPFLPPIQQQQPVPSPSSQSNTIANNSNNAQLPAHILEQQRILERIQRERAGATPVSSSASASSSAASVSPNSVHDPSPAYQPASSSSSSASSSASSSREASPPSVSSTLSAVSSSSSSSSSSSASAANSRAVRKQQLVQSVTSSVRQHLTKIHTDLGSHYDNVAIMQQDTNAQHTQLKAELANLDKQHATLTTALKQLQDANEKSKEWLERNETLQMPPIDKLIYPKDTWSKQLLESVCEDGAIEDTMYCLDRALEDDRIDIANFLKLTRSLARRQFHVRALALKLQAKLQEQNGPAQVPIPSNAFAAPAMAMTLPASSSSSSSSSSSHSSMYPHVNSAVGMHTMPPMSNAVVVGTMRY